MMKKTGVILFGMALGLFGARPASAAVASFSYDLVCSGNGLATCASVNVIWDTSNHITLTVTNLSDSDVITSIGLSGPGAMAWGGSPLHSFSGWGWSPSYAGGTILLQSPYGIAAGGSATFSFSFMGSAPGYEMFVASLNGSAVGGNDTLGEGLGGGDPDPEDVGTTHAPEPTSLLLLGTGLAGVAAARRRRRQGFEPEA